jgi:hypothetical protein
MALAIAVLFVASAARGDDALEPLDRLVASQRAEGGWTFTAEPGERPQPFTFVVKTAEAWLGAVGLATWDLVVVRSPGTPAAGLVLLEGWRRTGRAAYLDAARRAGDLLLSAELAHGGWSSELPVHGATAPWWFRWTADTRAMLDDDVTPGALRLLLALWSATGDRRYRDGAERALVLLEDAQLPSGAWPLDARPAWLRRLRPGREDQAALNDGATPLATTTLLVAASLLDRPALRDRARRAGDWLVAVQAPAPRAGWAQQYDADERPAPGRQFEPVALASWETRHAIEALLALAATTGDRRYCESALRAARWLDAVRVGPACWARFYDAERGDPVFVDPAGARVRSSAEARGGYGWMGEFGIPSLLARLGLAEEAGPRRVPGDPGGCAEDPRPPRPLAGARAMAAEAAVRLAADEPGAPAPCRITPPPDAAPAPPPASPSAAPRSSRGRPIRSRAARSSG